MFSTCTWLHAPPFLCGISFSPPSKLNGSHFSMVTSVRIAVVGDVHDDWSLEEDTKALQLLKAGAVPIIFRPSFSYFLYCRLGQLLGYFSILFVLSSVLWGSSPGDFGNENVDLVRSIANLEMAKSVILGNHDAWNTQKFSAREKDAVQLQLECLGGEHIGYGRMDFPNLKLSIVGGRPFSCGGQQLFRKKLLTARYGIHDMNGSAKRIYETALRSPEDHSVVFLAHNGPTGLGGNVDDICGKDWVFGGGDHGDPDLANAISQLKETTKLSVPLVVFGHMHKELAYGGLRKMIVVGDNNIVYLNGAIVPRVKRLGNEPVETSEYPGTIRAFTTAHILDGKVEKIAETWVSVIGDKTTLEEEHILFSKA